MPSKMFSAIKIEALKRPKMYKAQSFPNAASTLPVIAVTQPTIESMVIINPLKRNGPAVFASGSVAFHWPSHLHGTVQSLLPLQGGPCQLLLDLLMSDVLFPRLLGDFGDQLPQVRFSH